MAARRKPKQTDEKKPQRKARIPGLSARPVWQGQLRLSLVSCPVALYNATSRTNDISFHLINPETNNRIRMIATDPDTGPVNRSDLVRGYEIEKNRYVIMTEEDLDSVRLETTHTLDIERFVDAESIDRLFWSNPYLLMPGDDSAIDAYSVIREAMRGVGRIALGRVAMHTRERLIAVEPRGKGLLAYSLRMRDEVVDVDKAFDSIEGAKPSRQMIEIAEKIIEQAEGPFEPDEFRDRYEDALRDLIERKQKGEDTTVALPAPETSNVIDLMDALKKSLANKGAAPRSKPAKNPAAAKAGSKAKKRTRKSA